MFEAYVPDDVAIEVFASLVPNIIETCVTPAVANAERAPGR